VPGAPGTSAAGRCCSGASCAPAACACPRSWTCAAPGGCSCLLLLGLAEPGREQGGEAAASGGAACQPGPGAAGPPPPPPPAPPGQPLLRCVRGGHVRVLGTGMGGLPGGREGAGCLVDQRHGGAHAAARGRPGARAPPADRGRRSGLSTRRPRAGCRLPLRPARRSAMEQALAVSKLGPRKGPRRGPRPRRGTFLRCRGAGGGVSGPDARPPSPRASCSALQRLETGSSCQGAAPPRAPVSL
jgi:hypothetical protein